MLGHSRSKQLDVESGRLLHQALTATGDTLFQVLLNPEMRVLQAALKNPHLNEGHLLSLLKRGDLGEGLLKSIYQRLNTQSSHRLKVALVRNPNTPGPIVLTLLPHLHLFELVDLSLMSGVTPDQKYAAERALLKRLPTTELGNKMTLARRATDTVVGEILKEGEVRLLEICLNSPRLREVAVLQFINGARSSAEALSIIARHPKWTLRPNLRTALLKNHRTPTVWFTLFLPQLRTPDIRNLLLSKRLNPAQKKVVQGELKKRGMGSACRLTGQ